MDVKFKINEKERNLVKQLSALNCRFELNLEQGEISIVGMDNEHIEDVIKSINNEYNIEKMDINPTSQIGQPVTYEQPVPLGNIEIPDYNVQKYLDNYKKVIIRILEQNLEQNTGIGEYICKYILSAISEIEMKYEPREPIGYNIGDVVVCNFGLHLKGEISGGYVAAIVCHIEDDNTFYAVPITKRIFKNDINRYMQITENVDVDYYESKYTGGTVLLRKGRYIHKDRIKRIGGRVRPEFFKKLLEALPKAISFSYDDYAEKYEVVESDDNVLIVDENKDNTQKILDSDKLSAEEYLQILLADSLKKIDKSMPIAEQAEKFLSNIGFEINSEIIIKSFWAAFIAEKTVYESVIKEVKQYFPDMTEKSIKTTMIEEFKKWLSYYPELKEKYPTISFMVLLKVFVKKYLS